ncbi:MAG: hypothetical protein U1G07_17675 [Verrucomicrobiota bacterium]
MSEPKQPGKQSEGHPLPGDRTEKPSGVGATQSSPIGETQLEFLPNDKGAHSVSATVAENEKRKRRTDLEKIVDQPSFIERGLALGEIFDTDLYKPEFSNVEDYCIARWGIKHSQAYRLVDAAREAKRLSLIGVIKRESHARALLAVPVERREAVLRAALEIAKSEGRAPKASDFSDPTTANPEVITAKPSTESIRTQLRALWEIAGPQERQNFLAWVNANPEAADNIEQREEEDHFQCEACGETFKTDEEGVSLYECGSCDTRFTRETSLNGNHQCPDCNKFGTKVSDCGCPNCGEGELASLGHETPDSTKITSEAPTEPDPDATINKRTIARPLIPLGKSGRPTSLCLNDDEFPVKAWNQVPVLIADWLLRAGHCLPNLPYISQDKAAFTESARLKALCNGSWIEVGDDTDRLMAKARRLLETSESVCLVKCSNGDVVLHSRRPA